ncbi:sigma-70 family RNA polymerase sigma factor [Nocardiopsis sp. HNM0947]|uniref:Sigma-70 family RNA polymerase sigma factor n=1 Tax=Nocardiopsis coralli TaxID=2772213 RepID=A0ABR9PDE8_9ACTN|nr:sigma-70 family RNA polymerase sigma factor [Nocardiopsis coralli]MBE3001867.1 sigma-70 family RNA polymerase sigma factor [Nocardiopsis coralli]
MTRGTESGEPTGADARTFHDAFAAPLYRYAWSLLGGDAERATEAVHDALVAATLLDGERAAGTARTPWIYALTRAACQQRGLARSCPYTHLATVAAEEPVARMFAHLPAGQRELVELDLRHGLPPADVSRILGLSPGMCVELTRSAVRRADDNLRGLRDTPDPLEEDDEHAPATLRRHRAERVASALEQLRPPGPPPGLRGEVLASATDPGLTVVRERIVAAMRPLDDLGFPAHRVRTSAAEEGADEPGTAPEPRPGILTEGQRGRGAAVAVPLPRPLPEDRLTTADHPVRSEHTASLAAPGESPTPVEPERPRRVLPVVSGLATVAAAVGLWLWASALGGPATVVSPETAGPDSSPPVSGAAPTASDDAPGPALREDPGESASPSDRGSDRTQTPGDGASGPDAEPSAPQSPGEGGGEDRDGADGGSPEPPQDPQDPDPPRDGDPPGSDPDPGDPGDPGDPEAPEPPEEEAPEEDRGRSGVIGGLLDLFLGPNDT